MSDVDKEINISRVLDVTKRSLFFFKIFFKEEYCW